MFLGQDRGPNPNRGVIKRNHNGTRFPHDTVVAAPSELPILDRGIFRGLYNGAGVSSGVPCPRSVIIIFACIQELRQKHHFFATGSNEPKVIGGLRNKLRVREPGARGAVKLPSNTDLARRRHREHDPELVNELVAALGQHVLRVINHEPPVCVAAAQRHFERANRFGGAIFAVIYEVVPAAHGPVGLLWAPFNVDHHERRGIVACRAFDDGPPFRRGEFVRRHHKARYRRHQGLFKVGRSDPIDTSCCMISKSSANSLKSSRACTASSALPLRRCS